VITRKLAGLSDLKGERMLDVGCGDGSFTIPVGTRFKEVYGIDVQETYLERFREKTSGEDKFHIQNMSASAMKFSAGFFDTIVTIETIEHIPDLLGAAAEFARVIRPGGELLITCPNRLFPFENHGIRFRGKTFGRFPLITYIPPLHDRYSLARVFTVRKLKQIFFPLGFQLMKLDYAWPTFEHGGNRFQPLLKPLFGMMRWLEGSPLRMFGTSIVVRFDRL
jgi:2-polyprenyl-3-methyl-5-hydroxy-6-metoxy-1,4-benzoquinol methylase